MRSSALLCVALLYPGSQDTRGTVEVCAANLRDNTVSCYDAATGQPAALAVAAGAGGLRAPTGLTFGPDGNLYVSSSGTNQVLRFDGQTGAFLDVFVSDSALVQPFSVIFGPDGNLYVSSGARGVVLRFDGRTGRLLNVAARTDSLKTPIGLEFDRDGRLYVANAGGNNVSRFNARTGQRIDVFAVDGLRFPSDVAIDGAGDIYVSSAFAGRILRYDGVSGALRGVVGTLPDMGVPVGIRFLPDGDLVVADFAKSRLYRLPRAGGDPVLLTDQRLAGPENLAVRVRQ